LYCNIWDVYFLKVTLFLFSSSLFCILFGGIYLLYKTTLPFPPLQLFGDKSQSSFLRIAHLHIEIAIRLSRPSASLIWIWDLISRLAGVHWGIGHWCTWPWLIWLVGVLRVCWPSCFGQAATMFIASAATDLVNS